MSLLLKQEEKEKQQTGTVRIIQEERPSGWIPHAKLVSKDLRVKIKKNYTVNETKGKAMLVEQISLGEEKTLSVIVQETKDKSWVGMEFVHSSKEDVKKLFKTVPRQQIDTKLMTYPLIAMLFISISLEFWLIYKLAWKKELILITKEDWIQIILATMLLFSLMGWFYYWVHKQDVQVSNFTTTRAPVSRSFQVYFAGKRYIIECPTYGGFFWHDEMPDKTLFGYSVDELEEWAKDENGESIVRQIRLLNSQIQVVRSQSVQLFQELQDMDQELIEKQLELAGLMRDPHADPSRKKQLEKEIDELKAKRAELQLGLDELKKESREEIEKAEQQIAVLGQKYVNAIEKLIGKDKALDEKKKEQILNAIATIAALEDEVAALRNTVVLLERSHAGLYEEHAHLSETFNERVFDSVARQTGTNYEISIITYDPETGTSRINSSSQKPLFDTNKIIVALVWGAILLGGLAMFWQLIKVIINAFASLHYAVALALIFFMALALLLLFRIANKAVAWVSGADQTIHMK